MWFECCLHMQIMLQIIWHAALISSHHTMRCCHHSVNDYREITFVDFKMEVKCRNNRI
jgi:hypothetical protein